MAEHDEVVEAQLRGTTVRASWLVRFDFRSGEMRLWQGVGDLYTRDPRNPSSEARTMKWKGLRNLGALSAIQSGPGQAVEEMEFAIAGGPELVARFSEDQEEATGREVEVLLQWFDLADWSPLGMPEVEFVGVMGPLRAERPKVKAGGQATRIVSVRASNFLINRARSPNSYYSHRDQQARSQGDNIFFAMPKMADKRILWPSGFTS